MDIFSLQSIPFQAGRDANALPAKSVNLKVIYHPLYSMNNFVTHKSKLAQDGAQVFPYMG